MSRIGGADQGFTLLELLIVMSLLSATAVVAINLSSARRAALDLHRITLAISADLRQVAADAKRVGQDRLVRVSIGRPFSVAWRAATEVGSSNDSAVIVFFATGGSSGGSLRIARQTSQNIIEIDWLTSRIRIREDRGEPS
jgi:general secretion pathway protein H